jgi:hypothetical protein
MVGPPSSLALIMVVMTSLLPRLVTKPARQIPCSNLGFYTAVSCSFVLSVSGCFKHFFPVLAVNICRVNSMPFCLHRHGFAAVTCLDPLPIARSHDSVEVSRNICQSSALSFRRRCTSSGVTFPSCAPFPPFHKILRYGYPTRSFVCALNTTHVSRLGPTIIPAPTLACTSCHLQPHRIFSGSVDRRRPISARFSVQPCQCSVLPEFLHTIVVGLFIFRVCHIKDRIYVRNKRKVFQFFTPENISDLRAVLKPVYSCAVVLDPVTSPTHGLCTVTWRCGGTRPSRGQLTAPSCSP